MSQFTDGAKAMREYIAQDFDALARSGKWDKDDTKTKRNEALAAVIRVAPLPEEQDQAPIVTVPKAAAPDRGSVGEQIQREWAIVRKYMDYEENHTPEMFYDAVRKLDALIGIDDAK